MKVTVIAEAGVNHNGSLEEAKKLVDAAKAAGADVVKFQTFRAESLVTKSAPRAEYQARNIGGEQSQYDMLKSLELGYPEFEDLSAYCAEVGIAFLSTAFDSESLRFLAGTIGQRTFKVPSGELTNHPFLLEHALLDGTIIVSTGMGTLEEIEAALGVLAFGFLTPDAAPSAEAFAQAYASEEGRAALAERVVVLHCTSDYPAKPDDINLTAIGTLQERLPTPIGYSDHSEGIVVSLGAAAMGATLVEKHFTLDRELPGPDHKASLEPDELAEMIAGIRVLERAWGDGVKAPRPAELATAAVARKSLVAARDILVGEELTADNVTIKRPGTGISPARYWSVLGTTAGRGYSEGDLIEE